MKNAAVHALRILAALAVLLPGAGGIRAGTGPLLVVDLEEPFVVEEREFGPGTLTFRHLPDLSPAVSVAEVRVDGVALGRVPLRRGTPEVSWDADAALFVRDTRGRLVLVGLARRAGPDAGTFRLVSAPARPAEILVAAR